jgi:hypothetical protein
MDALGFVLRKIHGASLTRGSCQLLPADRLAEEIMDVARLRVPCDDAKGDGLGCVVDASVNVDEVVSGDTRRQRRDALEA